MISFQNMKMGPLIIMSADTTKEQLQEISRQCVLEGYPYAFTVDNKSNLYKEILLQIPANDVVITHFILTIGYEEYPSA